MDLDGRTQTLLNAMDLADSGQTAQALPLFEQVLRHGVNPVLCSYLAYCSACEEGNLADAVVLCRQMIQDDPQNPVHYLNLGRIYQCHGRRSLAIEAYTAGLKVEQHALILQQLKTMRLRRTAPIPVLSRGNLINKYGGILLDRLRLRKSQPVDMAMAYEDA